MAEQEPLKSSMRKESGAVYVRVLVCFAVCAAALFVTLIAYALSPGDDVKAVGQEEAPAILAESGVPAIASENVFHGQIVSITETPLSDVAPYDVAVLTGENPIPLSPVAPTNLADRNTAGEARPAPVLPTEPTATPAGAAVLLDTFTGRTVSFTGSVPHTYMGDGFTNNTIPGSTTYVSIRSYTFYMITAAVANYTDVHARLALWNTYVAGTSPVFSNNSAFFDVDLGALNVTTAPAFFAVTVMVSPPYPFFAGGPGTAWGYSQNFQGSTTGGAVADDTNLTSTICYGAPYAAGQILTGTSPLFGYYRNASNETDFNFLSSSIRNLANITSQGVGIILRGDPATGPTPNPPPTATPGTPSPTPGPTITPPSPQCTPHEGFDDITNLPNPKGWVMTNHSSVVGTTGWFQGSTAIFAAQSGFATNSYIAANYQNDDGPASDTISNWLLTPPVTLQNGGLIIFSTRTVDVPAFPDRLQVRMSTNGNSANVGAGPAGVGDFTTLLLDINPTYLTTGAGSYPNYWAQFQIQLTGIGLPVTGRIAFRYFVENGGPAGVNSDYIGIDTMSYTCIFTPPPTTPPPPRTPTPSPTPQPTGTPSPPCQPIITLSSSLVGTPGSVSCNNGVGHTDNSYWRAFNMNGFTAGAAYNVTSVSFGIESAFSNIPGAGTPTPTPGAPVQQVAVRLYTQNPGPVFPGGTRTLIAATTVNVPDQTATIFTAVLVATVPAGTSELIMEVFTPNGEAAGNLFFIGSNSATQGGPSYISATDCGITAPTDLTDIGFPNMHIIMNVNGACPDPGPITISGTAFNCASPAPTATPPASPSPPPIVPVSNVLMVLSGSSTGTTLTNGSGNYSFGGLAGGGTYTVTPSKGPLVPGSAEINTVDVLAIQRHFLALAVIPTGCRLNAADAVINGTVNTQDVLAVQRFFLGLTSGTGSSGQYHFTPANRSYPSPGMHQTNQNYAMNVIGDVAAQFANRPDPVLTEPRLAIP